MAANFRMIYSNTANSATLTSSSAASVSLGVTNLTNDIKSLVLRSVGTTQTITATWAAAQLTGGVMLPYTNLTSTATMRVQAYTEIADASPVYDTGTVLCCPAVPTGLLGWGTDLLGVNAYSYGGFSTGRLWFSQHYAIKKLVITVIDTLNPSGYVEIGRLVCGRYWEGTRNVDYGAAVTPVDTTHNYRNDAGDLLSDVGPKHRKLTFNLSNLSQADRDALWGILWGNGASVPVFFSQHPNATDTMLEQINQIYCKLTTSPAMASPTFLQYTSALELEEV